MTTRDEPGGHFTTRLAGGVAVVELSGRELRQPEPAREMGRELSEMIGREGHRRVLIDFRRVEGLGSTGFAALLSLARRLTQSGGRLMICGMPQVVRLGAGLVGLDQFVEYFDDERAALESP